MRQLRCWIIWIFPDYQIKCFKFCLKQKLSPNSTAWYHDTETWLNTFPIMQRGYPSGFHQKQVFIYSYLSGSVAHKWKHLCIVGANAACAGDGKLTSCLALRYPPHVWLNHLISSYFWTSREVVMTESRRSLGSVCFSGVCDCLTLIIETVWILQQASRAWLSARCKSLFELIRLLTYEVKKKSRSW